VYNLQYKHIKNLEANANPPIKIRWLKKWKYRRAPLL